MSLFKRIFKIGESNAHAVIDTFEDPIKMTEQGIRDLKKDLESAMISLAEVKGMAIRTRKEATGKKRLAEDYEKKAVILLKKAQGGSMDSSEAERLATQALEKKSELENEFQRLNGEASKHEKMADSLTGNVNKIKSTVLTYENDLTTLKARAKTAASTKKINAQLSRIDSSGTISMLEKMKARVEEDESIAEAYGELASETNNLDEKIDLALGKDISLESSAKLDELKKKMGIE